MTLSKDLLILEQGLCRLAELLKYAAREDKASSQQI